MTNRAEKRFKKNSGKLNLILKKLEKQRLDKTQTKNYSGRKKNDHKTLKEPKEPEK